MAPSEAGRDGHHFLISGLRIEPHFGSKSFGVSHTLVVMTTAAGTAAASSTGLRSTQAGIARGT